MSTHQADVVICGAGIAGIAAAYYLAIKQRVKNIMLVDERAPLTLTSDKGTAAYRNWFPGPDDAMVRLMNRSIDLLDELADESENFFQLNRRGYVFLTAQPEKIGALKKSAEEISALGAGPLRIHHHGAEYRSAPAEEFRDQPTGADLVLNRELIRREFPFVTNDVVAMLHLRRSGFFDAVRLGSRLLQRARTIGGVELRQDRVERISTLGGRVDCIHLASGDEIQTGTFVIAAGPFLKQVAALLDLDLPVFCELHAKVSIKDTRRIVPRNVPLMLWHDPLYLPWSESEKSELEKNAGTRPLLRKFPGGVHFRPRGEADHPLLLGLWTYDIQPQEPILPPTFDPRHSEVVLRGLARMIPALSAYFRQPHQATIDGGYYCKTRENRPLIGPLPVKGAYVLGALSGYGVMASQAAAELLAAHLTGAALPDYARSFLLERYDDPAYRALLENWDQRSGQL